MRHASEIAGQLENSHRAHLRAMTTARQEAERRKDSLRGASLESRREADLLYKAEIQRLDVEHKAWMELHGIG